jgi:hypothetical protein
LAANGTTPSATDGRPCAVTTGPLTNTVSDKRIDWPSAQWAGADVKLTMYRDLAHDCWKETYGNRELYRWFLSIKRKTQPKKK